MTAGVSGQTDFEIEQLGTQNINIWSIKINKYFNYMYWLIIKRIVVG